MSKYPSRVVCLNYILHPRVLRCTRMHGIRNCEIITSVVIDFDSRRVSVAGRSREDEFFTQLGRVARMNKHSHLAKFLGYARTEIVQSRINYFYLERGSSRPIGDLCARSY